MSDITIFVIGSLIFAITVYGSVMAGGLALTRAEERASGPDHFGDPVSPDAVTPAPESHPISSGNETETDQT